MSNIPSDFRIAQAQERAGALIEALSIACDHPSRQLSADSISILLELLDEHRIFASKTCIDESESQKGGEA